MVNIAFKQSVILPFPQANRNLKKLILSKTKITNKMIDLKVLNPINFVIRGQFQNNHAANIDRIDRCILNLNQCYPKVGSH